MYGSGRDGVFTFSKHKYNRAKLHKKTKQWKLLFPFFKGKTIPVFDSEYIYPGKNCYAFDLNGVLIPGRINITHSEDIIRGEVNPVPDYVRHWQHLEHQYDEKEFATETWWDKNKMLIGMIVTVIVCCALCAATIWWTFKFSAPRAAEMGNLAEAIKGFGTIAGG